MSSADTAGYRRALEPRELVFPQDHGPHPGFLLEWWYLVGHLEAETGRRFGYQLTFFRRAVTPEPAARASAWAASQLYMGHFALGDLDGGRFASWERFSRGAAGLAGARAVPFRVWIDDWEIAGADDGFLPLRLRARGGDAVLDLVLDSEKPLVLHGEEGLSRKSDTPGNASYYYSFTRLRARGSVRLGDRRWPVSGSGWLDHEWSTRGLEENQVGWDWFALQLDDGRDLMFYQLRRRDGSIEPASHGTLVSSWKRKHPPPRWKRKHPTADGWHRTLGMDDVEIDVLRTWRSPRGTVYPAGWRLRLAEEGLDLIVEPLLADQELGVALRYWEGAVGVRGGGAAGPVTGRGFVELVGYAVTEGRIDSAPSAESGRRRPAGRR